MIKRAILVMSIVTGIMCVAGSRAWAQDPIHKMGRGVVNVLTGWIELPKHIHLGKQEENPVIGMARGFVKGAGLTLLRGGVGVYEVLTFPIPYPKDYASPYEQMELNDYAWE